jgi:beta-glucosidase/6-phospho-beta-glucosidase/beta-galactosidase
MPMPPAPLPGQPFSFSISWSRILLDGGRGTEVNAGGIKFYQDLVDEMLAAGIKPAATMFHCAGWPGA